MQGQSRSPQHWNCLCVLHPSDDFCFFVFLAPFFITDLEPFLIVSHDLIKKEVSLFSDCSCISSFRSRSFNSPGVTEGTAKDTLLAAYNDINNVKALFEANKNEIAAIIIEPVAGNMGCIPPAKGFLEALRAVCSENGALLIFDEVMTGFRLAKGGAQELYGVQADIVCFGKVIGGGLPVGAFAARNEIMNYLAPIGPVYQAGTLSGNPLAMAAGKAMLEALNNDAEIFTRLEEKTAYLHQGIQKVLTENNIDFTINRVGSMISVHFDKNPVFDFQTAKNGDNETFKKFFHGLLNEGIYIAPSAYETWFITDALTYQDLDFTINAINKVAKSL